MHARDAMHGVSTVHVVLLAEKFIVLPAARVVFDIIRNADQFILAANNVILKTWLPSEFNMQFIGGRCY